MASKRTSYASMLTTNVLSELFYPKEQKLTNLQPRLRLQVIASRLVRQANSSEILLLDVSDGEHIVPCVILSNVKTYCEYETLRGRILHIADYHIRRSDPAQLVILDCLVDTCDP